MNRWRGSFFGLTDLGDFDFAVFLTVAVFFMDAFFRVITNVAHFFAFYFWLDYFRLHLYAANFRRSDGRFFAIDHEQSRQFELFRSVLEEVHQEGLFLSDEILVAAEQNYCLFHIIPFLLNLS